VAGMLPASCSASCALGGARTGFETFSRPLNRVWTSREKCRRARHAARILQRVLRAPRRPDRVLDPTNFWDRVWSSPERRPVWPACCPPPAARPARAGAAGQGLRPSRSVWTGSEARLDDCRHARHAARLRVARPACAAAPGRGLRYLLRAPDRV